jgi:tetratricopeptide (TPR) repeat protein
MSQPQFNPSKSLRPSVSPNHALSDEESARWRDHGEQTTVKFMNHWLTVVHSHAGAGVNSYNFLGAVMQLENLKQAMDYANESGEWSLLCQLVDAVGDPQHGLLYVCGYWNELEKRLRQAVFAVEQNGRWHDVAAYMSHLAALWFDRGDWSAAKAIYEQILTTAQAQQMPYLEALSSHMLGLLAQETGELDLAQALYERSLSLKAEGSEKISALFQLGSVAQARGDYEQAQQHYRQAQQLAEQLNDQLGQVWLSVNLGTLAQTRGDFQGAQLFYQQGLHAAQEIGSKADIGILHHQLGSLAHQVGNYEEAAACYHESLEIATELQADPQIAAIQHNLGALAEDQGRYAMARRHYLTSLTIEEKLGHLEGIYGSHYQLGNLAIRAGERVEARQAYEKCLAISQKLDNPTLFAKTVRQLGMVAEQAEQYDEAAAWYAQALRTELEQGDLRGQMYSLHCLGSLALTRGYGAKAVEYFQQSLTIARAFDDLVSVALNQHSLACIKFEAGALTEAQALFAASLSAFQTLGNKYYAAICLSHLGDIAFQTERMAEARQLYEQSMQLLEELADEGGEIGLSDLATLLLKLGDLAVGDKRYLQADVFFKRSQSLTAHPQLAGQKVAELKQFLRFEKARRSQQARYTEDVARLGINGEVRHLHYQPVCLNRLPILFFLDSHRDYAAEKQHYEEQLTIAQRAGNALEIADAQHELATLFFEVGDYAEAEKLYQVSLASTPDGHDYQRACTLYQLSLLYLEMGDPLQAGQYIQQSLGAAQQWQSERLLADVFHQAGIVTTLGSAPDYHLAQQRFEESLRLKEKHGDETGMSLSLGEMAYLEQLQGEWDTAEKIYLQAVELEYKRGALDERFGIHYFNLSAVYEEQRNFSTALALLERASAIFMSKQSWYAIIAQTSVERVRSQARSGVWGKAARFLSSFKSGQL